MRRASAFSSWLATTRSQITPARNRSVLLSTKISTWQAATAPRTASSILGRLGLGAVHLRPGLKRNPVSVRRYATEGTPTSGKGALNHTLYRDFQSPPSLSAESAEALDALCAEFYQWQRRALNWNIAGISIPKAVLWLVLAQFLGPTGFSLPSEGSAGGPVGLLREGIEEAKRRVSSDVPPLETEGTLERMLTGYRVTIPDWERTALHGVASLALVSVIALFWARRRTKNGFNSFVLSRALGETPGTFPIGKKDVKWSGDSIKIKGDSLKLVRKQVVRLAGVKAVQASTVLLLSSALSSYALTSWLNARVRDDVLRLRRSDARQGETILSGLLLFNFIVSWLVLLYQPYTIFPLIAGSILAPLLPVIPSNGFEFQKLLPTDTTVTERTEVIEVEGGKEYVTIRETKTGSGAVSKSEMRVFIPDHGGAPWGEEKEWDETVEA